jgi:hypothetical protein
MSNIVRSRIGAIDLPRPSEKARNPTFFPRCLNLKQSAAAKDVFRRLAR